MSVTRRIVLGILLAAGVTVCRPVFAGEDQTKDKPADAEGAAERPVPAIRRALVVSCDGLRPDLVLRAKTPNMRRLMENGSYTLWAQTVKVSITLPSHTSMLTGVSPERHGVHWNDDQPALGYPKVPTLFEVAKKAGLTTAIAAGKSKFTTLNKPGTVDWASISAASDEDVAKHAKEIIREHKPDVMLVHFPGVDGTGHRKGWGSPEQIEAIENVDKQLGVVLKALDDKDVLDSTVVLLSADHGGMGLSHGGEDPRSLHIPWIISGPGIRKNRDLTIDPTLHVRTEDTFVTLCYLLGLPAGEVEGKPIRQVVEQGELLQKRG